LRSGNCRLSRRVRNADADADADAQLGRLFYCSRTRPVRCAVGKMLLYTAVSSRARSQAAVPVPVVQDQVAPLICKLGPHSAPSVASVCPQGCAKYNASTQLSAEFLGCVWFNLSRGCTGKWGHKIDAVASRFVDGMVLVLLHDLTPDIHLYLFILKSKSQSYLF
jgi:hypothetical protein